jgi:hypothetical protein
MRHLLLLAPVAIACCAAAGDAVRPGARAAGEASIASPAGARAGEVSLRELGVTVKGAALHAVQIVVRDPATGLFWSDVMRKAKPMQAREVWNDWWAAFRFAANDEQIAAFHLHSPFLDATSSGRRAASLPEAEEIALGEVRGEAKEPVRVNLEQALGRAFVYDSEIHPARLGLTIDSVTFENDQWVVTIRNERNATGRLFFSRSMNHVSTK